MDSSKTFADVCTCDFNDRKHIMFSNVTLFHLHSGRGAVVEIPIPEGSPLHGNTSKHKGSVHDMDATLGSPGRSGQQGIKFAHNLSKTPKKRKQPLLTKG